MTRKDITLSHTLKKAFPAQQKKEKLLCERILLHLPKRNNLFFILPMIYKLFSCCIFILLIFNIKTIINTIDTILIFVQEHQIPDKGNIIAIVISVSVVAFLLWQIYSTIEDYYLLKNDETIRQLQSKKNNKDKAVFYL